MTDDERNRRASLLEEWKKTHPNPTSGDIVRLLHSIGRPPDVYPPELDPNKVRCACNKDVPCERAKLINTGYMHAIEPICEPCRPDFEGQARLVCVRCRSVIGWMDPQTDKHGFKIEPDKYYHVGECMVCDPNVVSSHIIEMALYYDEIGIPYEKKLIK